jgi:hypothetical protein
VGHVKPNSKIATDQKTTKVIHDPDALVACNTLLRYMM